MLKVEMANGTVLPMSVLFMDTVIRMIAKGRAVAFTYHTSIYEEA